MEAWRWRADKDCGSPLGPKKKPKSMCLNRTSVGWNPIRLSAGGKKPGKERKGKERKGKERKGKWGNGAGKI